jgi:hypothetical protein
METTQFIFASNCLEKNACNNRFFNITAGKVIPVHRYPNRSIPFRVRR